MGLAVEPPVRLDLSCRPDDDKLVPVVWLRADNVTPIPITSAVVTITFDLPNDDTWERDPDTDAPVEPERQVHIITSTTPGDPAGWIIADQYVDGQVLAYISHVIWTTITPPYTGTWALVVISTEAVQRCLARGEINLEGTP